MQNASPAMMNTYMFVFYMNKYISVAERNLRYSTNMTLTIVCHKQQTATRVTRGC